MVNLSFDEYALFFKTTSRDLFCRFPSRTAHITTKWLRSWFFTLNKASLKALRLLELKESPLHAIMITDLPEYSFIERRFYDTSRRQFIDVVENKLITFVYGRFFRDYNAFVKHQDIIREYFTPIPAISEKLNIIISKARQKAYVLVGVHIRQGDYRKFVDGKYYYTLDQYRHLMRQVAAFFKGNEVVFLICSDEPLEEKIFEEFIIARPSNQIVEDMYSLACCDYLEDVLKWIKKAPVSILGVTTPSKNDEREPPGGPVSTTD